MLECYYQWKHLPYLQADVDIVSDEVEVKAEEQCDKMSAEDNEMSVANV